MNYNILPIALVAVALMGAYSVAVATDDANVTTTVTLADDITCTINGKDAGDWQRITVDAKDGKLNIHLESNHNAKFVVAGDWKVGESNVSFSEEETTSSTSADYTVDIGTKGGSGVLSVWDASADDDCDLHLKCSIDAGLNVTCNGNPISDGDVLQFSTGHMDFTVHPDTPKNYVIYVHWVTKDGVGYTSAQGAYNDIDFPVNMDIRAGANGTVEVYFK